MDPNPITTTVRINSWLKFVLRLVICGALAYWFFIGLLSPAKAIATPTPPPTPSLKLTLTPTPTPDEDSIGTRIKERLLSATPSARTAGFVGIVTDKTDKNISLDTRSGLRQIVISGSKVIKQKDSSKQTVKPEDIAIGDYLIAMGTINGSSGSLTAKRILILPTPKPIQKVLMTGILTQVKATLLSVEVPNKGDVKIKTTKSTRIFRSSDSKTELKLTVLDLREHLAVLGVKTSDTELEAKLIVILTDSKPTPSDKQASPTATLKPTKKLTATPSPLPKN